MWQCEKSPYMDDLHNVIPADDKDGGERKAMQAEYLKLPFIGGNC